MVQEYLINDEEEKKAISEYKPDGVESALISIENGSCWCVRYSATADNEKTARKMSEVDAYVREHFNVTILRSDCAEYLTNHLYPLMSQFERKLRKLLYLFSGIKKDKESSKKIKELENKDFGEIFTLLFIDKNFMGAIKESVKIRDKEFFSKREIQELIDNTEENTVWDELFDGDDVVPTLRARFQDVRKIRNDIMHSHNISYGEYLADRRLIRKINKEIDDAMENVNIKEQIAKRPVPFGKTLAEAVIAQDEYFSGLQTAVQAFNSIADYPGIEKMKSTFENIASAVQTPEFVETQSALQQVAEIYNNPMLQQIAEQQEVIAKITAPFMAMNTYTEAVRAQKDFLNRMFPQGRPDSDRNYEDNSESDGSIQDKSDEESEQNGDDENDA